MKLAGAVKLEPGSGGVGPRSAMEESGGGGPRSTMDSSLTQLAPASAVLSPAPSATMSPPLSEPDRADTVHGGRLSFYSKDGRMLLELAHGSDSGSDRRWVAVPRKRHWTPPTVSARMEHVASFSDDGSSVQSSPWPVDPYRRKQAAPHRCCAPGSRGSVGLLLRSPLCRTLWTHASCRPALRRLCRRPHAAVYSPPEGVTPCSTPTRLPKLPAGTSRAERSPPEGVAPCSTRTRLPKLPAGTSRVERSTTLETLVQRLAERRRPPVHTVRPTQTVRIRPGPASPAAWQPSPRKRPHARDAAPARAARMAKASPAQAVSAVEAAGSSSPSTGAAASAGAVASAVASAVKSEAPSPPARPRGNAGSAYSIDSLLSPSPASRGPARPAPRRPIFPPAAGPSASACSPPPPPAPALSGSGLPVSLSASLACQQSRYMHYLREAYSGLPAPYPLLSPLLYSQLANNQLANSQLANSQLANSLLSPSVTMHSPSAALHSPASLLSAASLHSPVSHSPVSHSPMSHSPMSHSPGPPSIARPSPLLARCLTAPCSPCPSPAGAALALGRGAGERHHAPPRPPSPAHRSRATLHSATHRDALLHFSSSGKLDTDREQDVPLNLSKR